MSEKLGTNLAEVGTDCISRQAIDKFIDGLEEIFADLRERHVDDSVCGLCEYDGAYIGQSGDWCNECPGFDKDDCFKLSDKTRKEWTEEIIKALPPAQPEQDWIPVSKEMPPLRHDVWLTVFFHESWRVLEGYRQDGEFMFWYHGRLESALDEENRVTAWKPKSKPYQPDAK